MIIQEPIEGDLPEQFDFCSVPIVSSYDGYCFLAERCVASFLELRKQAPEVCFAQIVQPNIVDGIKFARSVAEQSDLSVFTPIIVDEQHHSLSQGSNIETRRKLIERCVRRLWMPPGWEYSDVCAEEYLQAVQMSLGFRDRWDIAICDCDGNPIPLHSGIWRISTALEELYYCGFRSLKLVEVLRALASVCVAYSSPEIMHELPRDRNELFVGQIDNGVVGRTERNCFPLIKNAYQFEHFYLSIDTRSGVVLVGSGYEEEVLWNA